MKRWVWLVLLGWLSVSRVYGQITALIILDPSVNLYVQTAADYLNGVSASEPTATITVALGRTFTLQVRAAGNLMNGMNSIPVESVFVQVTSPAPVQPEKQLSTSYTTILTGRAPIAYIALPVTIKYRLASSPNILKPGGAYSTTLTFTLSAL